MSDLEIGLGIGGIIASGGVGLTIYILDRKREKKKETIRKKIIQLNLNELGATASHIYSKLVDLEVNEEEIAHELTVYLTRKNYHIRTILNNIRLYQTQCTSLTDKQNTDIVSVIDSMNSILDEYTPEGMPPDRRITLWTQSHTKLDQNIETITQIQSLVNEPIKNPQ